MIKKNIQCLEHVNYVVAHSQEYDINALLHVERSWFTFSNDLRNAFAKSSSFWLKLGILVITRGTSIYCTGARYLAGRSNAIHDFMVEIA
jgi:hypothetical protein